MPSSAVAGFKSFVKVSSDGGSTWSNVSEQMAATLRILQDKVDITNKTTSISGDMLYKERLVVSIDWSGTVNGNLTNDVIQTALQTACLSGTPLQFRFMRTVGSGQPMLSGSALVEMEQSLPLTDAAKVNYTLTGTGALTAGTQA